MEPNNKKTYYKFFISDSDWWVSSKADFLSGIKHWIEEYDWFFVEVVEMTEEDFNKLPEHIEG